MIVLDIYLKQYSCMRKASTRPKKNEEEFLDNTKIQKIDVLQKIHIELKYKNEEQKALAVSIKSNDVTIGVGPAGTGKSLCSLATALKLLKDNKVYQKLILLKSVTQLVDETLPALPGDAMEKMHYQNMSFMDSLIDLVGEKVTGDLVTTGLIKFDVIGSLRGRNLANRIVILDECQNVTHGNLMTILTRLSSDAKLIILGDPNQIDIKRKKDSSLGEFIKRVRANPISGVSLVEFNEDLIVRHRLTKYFINLFKEPETEDTTTEPIILLD